MNDFRAAILDWCGEDEALRLLETQDELEGFRIRVRFADAGLKTIVVIQQLEPDDRIRVSHSFNVTQEDLEFLPGENLEGKAKRFVDMVDEISLTRAGPLTCQVQKRGDEFEVVISYVIYLDGFSRNSFMEAIKEVSKSKEQVTASVAVWGVKMEELKQAEREVSALRGEMTVSSVSAQLDPADPIVIDFVCASCGFSNPAGSRFCNQCGTSLAA